MLQRFREEALFLQIEEEVCFLHTAEISQYVGIPKTIWMDIYNFCILAISFDIVY